MNKSFKFEAVKQYLTEKYGDMKTLDLLYGLDTEETEDGLVVNADQVVRRVTYYDGLNAANELQASVCMNLKLDISF